MGGEEDARRVMSSNEKQVRNTQSRRRDKIHYPFWFGGSSSCLAATVTHPLDLGKLSLAKIMSGLSCSAN